ncbi:transposase [uncultured Nonlabens sp.]|uniref:transposase n=1 Tax=uncultured Nonlabens sp. TaxID=859306 RepID=UPI00345AB058
MDNTGFHSTKNIDIPENIYLLRIPSYNPELNAWEEIGQKLKKECENQRFTSMNSLRE